MKSSYEVTLYTRSFNEVAQREPGAGREQTPSQPEDQVFFGQVLILNFERKKMDKKELHQVVDTKPHSHLKVNFPFY